MKGKLTIFALGVLMLSLVAACGRYHVGHGDCANCSVVKPQTAAMVQAGDQGARHDVLYTCACGDQCNCNSVSAKPGNCR